MEIQSSALGVKRIIDWFVQFREALKWSVVSIVCLCTGFPAWADWRLVAQKADSSKQISSDGTVRLRIFTAKKVGDSSKVYRLIWAVLPSDRYQARIQVATTSDRDIETEVKKCDGDLALTGGFSYRGRPNGWVISDSKQISEPAPFDSGGALIVTSEGSTIVRKSDIKTHSAEGRALQALQSKPILIFDGKHDGASEKVDSWNRAAIGVTDGGDLLVAHLDGEVSNSLSDFARILLTLSDSKQSPKLRAALALDSRTSGHIFVRKEAAHFGAGGENVTSIICFQPKKDGK